MITWEDTNGWISLMQKNTLCLLLSKKIKNIKISTSKTEEYGIEEFWKNNSENPHYKPYKK